MIVIANKTAYRLRDDLSKVIKQKPNQRCLILKFSKCTLEKDKLFETFLRILDDIPNAYMAKVYLCDDKDIFIIMEGFMQRHFTDFAKTLSLELDIDDFSNLLSIHEISTHWEIIENFYKDKISAIDKATETIKEEERKKRAEENMHKVLLEIDPAHIANINKKRQSRDAFVVMIADDDQLSRTLAGNVLRSDYDCYFAKNGTETLQEYVSIAPDILFLDIGMPDIGGHEILESLFQIDPNTYVIMFSGRKDKMTVLKSLELGAQGFLGKPFTRQELYSHVENTPSIKIKKV